MLMAYIAYTPATADDDVALSKQLQDYCVRYVDVASERLLHTVDAEVTVLGLEQKSWMKGLNWLGNVVSPPDSRIWRVYHCTFRIGADSRQHTGSVDFPLIENREFAEHTHWQKLQFLSLDETVQYKDSTYYLAPKYLKIDDRLMHLDKQR